MTYGLVIGGERTQVARMSRDEYRAVRQLRPFTSTRIVQNQETCPKRAGLLIQMPSPLEQKPQGEKQ